MLLPYYVNVIIMVVSSDSVLNRLAPLFQIDTVMK